MCPPLTASFQPRYHLKDIIFILHFKISLKIFVISGSDGSSPAKRSPLRYYLTDIIFEISLKIFVVSGSDRSSPAKISPLRYYLTDIIFEISLKIFVVSGSDRASPAKGCQESHSQT